MRSKKKVTYKKYLYAYRGIVNSKWVLYNNSIPPIIFTKALEGVKNKLPETVVKKLEEIIELKAKGKEQDIVQNIVSMDKHIESYLKEKDIDIQNKRRPIEILEQELQKIILG